MIVRTRKKTVKRMLATANRNTAVRFTCRLVDDVGDGGDMFLLFSKDELVF